MLAQLAPASSRAARSARWKRVSLANAFGLTPTASRNTRRRCRSLTPRSTATAFTLALVSLSAASRARRAWARRPSAIARRSAIALSRMAAASVRVARAGEPIAEPPRRRVAPQILERDDAPGDGGGGHAEHRLGRAQAKARRHRSLAAADELSMHPPSHAERVHVETALRRRPEANDELDLRARNRYARRVAVALVDEERRHGRGGRTRSAQRDGGRRRSRACDDSDRARDGRASFGARLSVSSNRPRPPAGTFCP